MTLTPMTPTKAASASLTASVTAGAAGQETTVPGTATGRRFLMARVDSPVLLAIVQGLAIALSIAVIVVWSVTAAERVGNPYPIEWQEGAITFHAFRLLDGLPLYVAPSPTFIPVLYPPFGYVVQTWAMAILGRGLPAARAVSLVATFAIALIIVLVVRRQTGSRLAALLAVGLFFAAYYVSFAWYDQARVDMLFMLLSLLSLVILTRERLSTVMVVSSGLLAALAILTKQQALVFAGAGFVHLFFRVPRKAFIFAATIAAVLVPTVLVLQMTSDGWFLRETWTYLSRYPLRRDYLPRALRAMLYVTIPLLFAAAWVLAGVRRGEWKRLVSIWTLAFVVAVGSGFMSMIHDGAASNHLIPMVVVAVIMQGMLFGELSRSAKGREFLALWLVLALAPFAFWPWPHHAMPSRELRRVQKDVVAEIAALPGEVLVLEDSYYGWLAGKGMNPDGSSLRSLSDLGLWLPPGMVNGLEAHEYDVVVLSYRVENKRVRSKSGNALNKIIRDNYVFSRTIASDSEEMSVLRVPRHIYLPRSRVPADLPRSPRPTDHL